MITNILSTHPSPSITEWNKLPSTTINSPSVEDRQQFKDQLKAKPPYQGLNAAVNFSVYTPE